MDRPIVYAGSVPLDTDLLRLGRYAKEGLGRLASVLLGSETVTATGLACTVSSESLSVAIGPGTIVAPYALDWTRIGSPSAGLDAAPVVTQCLFHHDEEISLDIPLTGAVVTVYAVCREADDCNEVLPFFDADDPDRTMAGPDNRGKALPTRRAGQISFVIATSQPNLYGAVVVPLYRLDVPSSAATMSGVVPRAAEAFRPRLADYATIDFVQQIVQSHALCFASQILTIPAWASHVELRVIGAGGGGASSSAVSAESGSFSGGGGGAGGDAWGIYRVDPHHSAALSVTIGLGGGPDNRGGTSFVTYDGTLLLSAEGGAAGQFTGPQNASGGSGGSATGGTLWSLYGGCGSDGQAGTYVFAGNGADGPWGGAGSAGALLGHNATKYGAGGGGAYGARAEGQTSLGGRGFQGCVIYRFQR